MHAQQAAPHILLQQTMQQTTHEVRLTANPYLSLCFTVGSAGYGTNVVLTWRE